MKLSDKIEDYFIKLGSKYTIDISSIDYINCTLQIYDTVVLPMNLNTNLNLLANIEEKDRITLFGNAGCALTCPDRICYDYISKRNKILGNTNFISRVIYFYFSFLVYRKWCMVKRKPRKLHGIKDFDL